MHDLSLSKENNAKIQNNYDEHINTMKKKKIEYEN